MLTTPLGDIDISDMSCPDINGRYAITIDFIPNRKIHTISCKIKGHVSSKREVKIYGKIYNKDELWT